MCFDVIGGIDKGYEKYKKYEKYREEIDKRIMETAYKEYEMEFEKSLRIF